MTDLDKIKLCAEAVLRLQGIGYGEADGKLWYGPYELEYDPFHDDAQAMALEDWLIEHVRVLSYYDRKLRVVPVTHANVWDFPAATREERRRAIVECVAQMQAAKVHA